MQDKPTRSERTGPSRVSALAFIKTDTRISADDIQGYPGMTKLGIGCYPPSNIHIDTAEDVADLIEVLDVRMMQLVPGWQTRSVLVAGVAEAQVEITRLRADLAEAQTPAGEL